MVCLWFFIAGFLLKIYLFKAKVSMVMLSPICVGPLVLLYSIELFKEFFLDLAQSHKSRQIMLKLCKDDPEIRTKHSTGTAKINCGLFQNFIIFAGYNSYFMYLLAAKIDGTSHVNLFIILIPLWVLLLYIFSFMVLKGLASSNSKVNKCEKIILSLMVPIGILSTVMLGVCRLEKIIDWPIFTLLIPLIMSLLSLYLFVRCLIRPSSDARVHNAPQK